MTGCWLWQHHVNPAGYPRAVVQQRKISPAHIAYEQVHGPIPAGHVLAATCPHRRCICPAHRVAVPRAEIAAATGHGLTAAQVRHLRAEAPDRTVAELATAYGVRTDAIRQALAGRSWPRLGGAPVTPRKPPRKTAARQRWAGRLPAVRPEAMPEREWQALVAFVRGQTLQQIGDGLGLTRQRVAAIVAGAYERLAGVLDDEDKEDAP